VKFSIFAGTKSNITRMNEFLFVYCYTTKKSLITCKIFYKNIFARNSCIFFFDFFREIHLIFDTKYNWQKIFKNFVA